jgi:hypothetical protein
VARLKCSKRSVSPGTAVAEHPSQVQSHLRLSPSISTIEIIDRSRRLSPHAPVEDQQSEGHNTPDQRAEPKHPGCVGTGRPQRACLDGAIGRVRDQCQQRAARGVVKQPGVPARDGDGG